MEIKITVPEYSAKSGIQYNWVQGFEITAKGKGSVHIKANKEGLISLASHLINLAQDAVPAGTHLHFDEFNSLESGSLEILIEKS